MQELQHQQLKDNGEEEMEKYRLETKPKAVEENIIEGVNYRITVLTPRLMRLEYSENSTFVDQASQTILNRNFQKSSFQVKDTEDELQITTEYLYLSYNKKKFSPNGLSIQVLGNISIYYSCWHYGETGENLGGTARTLDEVDGSCLLEDGLLSRNGFAILDDSRSLLLTEDGWVESRGQQGEDIYFFGYGRDYKACLKDFYFLCGKTPMLPRYALGNWWSRFYKYNEESYKNLMLQFEKEEIPFSVAVIDMDWHLVDIDEKYGSGWTGFTWNRELFPNPEEFMSWLHKKNLKVTLNLHPADGIRGYEEMYPKIAKELGVDIEKEEPVLMDVTNREFLEAYFKYAHHPNEAAGVDFWWVDWQQGTHSKIDGLDPLWMLNHFYFLDSGRNGKRPMTFSRYAGPGSHRYPVGFSGDSIISWKTLEFQPYFTATASNIGYGWWSHDIGGHMKGIKDDEMATRWLQFGIFSPIMRLHSSSSEFNGKEPWRYNQESCTIMKQFLRLRHQIIPYMYSMNYRNYKKDLPLIEPMYYEHPEQEEAYQVKNQYYFGSECIVAPITGKRDEKIGLAAQKVWLPEGNYIDFFTGLVYQGGRIFTCYRELSSIPVFLKEGAILPMMDKDAIIEENPSTLKIKVFPGKNNQFELYEDDNTTIAYQRGDCTKTIFELQEKETKEKVIKIEFIIHQSLGNLSLIPKKRNYHIELLGVEIEDLKVYLGNNQLTPDEYVINQNETKILILHQIPVTKKIRICFKQKKTCLNKNIWERCFDILNKAQISFEEKDKINQIIQANTSNAVKLMTLVNLKIDPTLLGAIGELLTACAVYE